ncbi:MAG: bifunctional 5,10-methylenetetrahydrofolate dehydrogenase/5,10-methenyltetrahydrofolate cyclohydrolase [Pirellulales bacterium]
MTATILDGKELAHQMQADLAVEVAEFIENNSVFPRLDVVLIGDNAASEVYVRNKRQACERAGIDGHLHRLPAGVSIEEMLALVHKLNKDPDVHGILVQLPLPSGLDPARVLQAVNPLKDVDAFHPENVGLLVQGRPRFVPCTPHGIVELLKRRSVPIAGRHVVILGRSDIVGKPLANLLLQRGTDATVTVCHSRTPDVGRLTRLADILVVAIGRPRFVTAEMVQPGAAVIDVGMNRTPEGLVGDVDFESVREVAGMITPVPGGVGPLTVTMLLHNTLVAARVQQP